MNRKILSLAATTVLLLAACRNGGNDSPVVPPTVTQAVTTEIANYTTDSALPLDLNTLQLSDADTDETSLPLAVN